MKVSCPHCDQHIDAPDELLGTEVTCPACESNFTLPDPDPEPPEVAVAVPVAQAIPADPVPQAIPVDSGPDVESLNAHLVSLFDRFAAEGFRMNDKGNSLGFPFVFSASKVRFDWVGVPTFLEEFFVFQEFPEIDTPVLDGFIEGAWQWAMENENNVPNAAELSRKALLFAMKNLSRAGAVAADQMERHSAREVTCLVYVYAIAVTPSIAAGTLEWLHSKKSAAGRKHGIQGTFVVPMILDTSTGGFEFFKKRPILGNVYYSEARKVIRKRLLG